MRVDYFRFVKAFRERHVPFLRETNKCGSVGEDFLLLLLWGIYVCISVSKSCSFLLFITAFVAFFFLPLSNLVFLLLMPLSIADGCVC